MFLPLGGRALSSFLCMIGCSSGLALAIVFAVKALLTAEVSPNMVLPAGGFGRIQFGSERQPGATGE